MKCLVLGGGGFLGSHLSQALLEAGHTVRIFDLPHRKRFAAAPPQRLEWVEGDFANPDDLEPAVSGCDILYHLVCTTLPSSSNENPAYDVETNVVSTLRLLDLARKKRGVKVIFVSSGGTVYGIPESVPLDESHPTNPICSYGVTKLAVEKYLFLYRQLYGLDSCVLRLANPFGERQEASVLQGAVSVFLNKAFHDEVIEIWGDGSVIRDYIYVKDAVDALVRAAEHSGKDRLFNIGSGQGRSLNEILSEIGQVLGRPVRHAFAPARACDVPANVLDISLARKSLGWRPRTSFQEGLRATLAWIKKGSS